MPNIIVLPRKKYYKRLSLWEYRRYYPVRWLLWCQPMVLVGLLSLYVLFYMVTGLSLIDIILMVPRTTAEVVSQSLVTAGVFILIFSPVLFIVPRKR